ncbi:MAG: helix-turn-helix domain-containing protein [Pseudonocardiaceae bacterium]|nr:helix-turn-helix domain-containing protein [Pseudonocardiaceae bacterium]
MTTQDRLLLLGDQLRQLRKAAKITGKVLAQSAGWQPSKLSRLENGQQLISEQDLATWCEVLGLSKEDTAALHDEVRGIRLDQARWRNRTGTGHEVLQQTFGEAEQAATHVRNFETGLVPGLVQTPDYARAVFTAFSRLSGAPDDADDAVRARLQRQTILYDSSKHIELLMTEAALRHSVATPEVMIGQLDRLQSLLELSNVRLGILPLDLQLPAPVMHGFWMLDDLVTIEVTNTEIATREPGDVKLFSDMLAALWKVAAEGDEAQAVLRRVADELRSLT